MLTASFVCFPAKSDNSKKKGLTMNLDLITFIRVEKLDTQAFGKLIQSS